MGPAETAACAPLLLLAVTTVVELLVVSFHRGERAAAIVALVGLVLACAALPVATTIAPVAVSPLLSIDRYALYYIGLVLIAALATLALCYGYLREGASGELYVLLLLATLGAAALAASVHFASFFLGLELLSVSLYALIAHRAVERRAIEAGLKYLVLAGASSAFLLFGMALIYAELGTLSFDRMAALVAAAAPHSAVWFVGLALIATGVGFKLALVPFHLWTPDVYQGAPAPVTAFIATASKASVFAVLLRFFAEVHVATFPSVVLAVAIVAGFSMFVGNLLALVQTNVKRILAYSSIAHLGYLLIALIARGPLAMQAVGYYLAAYVLTMLGAFAIVAIVSRGGTEAEELDDYRGLFWRRPAVAAAFTIALLSLASIPVTGGFVGKIFVVAAGASSSFWALLVILAINSAIGLFYYLRIVVAMYSAPAEPPRRRDLFISLPSAVALTVLTAGILWLGLYPAPIVRLLHGTSTAALRASAD